MPAPLLQINSLHVAFPQRDGSYHDAVNHLSLEIFPGEILALVGESGSGKSMTALSILGLLPQGINLQTSGQILFDGKNLLEASEKELQELRGNRIAMIFQEPMTALNPVLTVETQLCEVLQQHEKISKDEAHQRGLQLLRDVNIPDPERRIKEYPHQLSGGMRQRIMIAMALACRPSLLIADEPTTALDVTVQAQILALLQKLRREYNTAILLITHNLLLVREQADRVAVMTQGQCVECAPVQQIFAHPTHPYTKHLLEAIPREKTDDLAKTPGNILEIKNLQVHFPVKGGWFSHDVVHAVDNLSFSLAPGETLALVGESGCGKTTVGKAIIELVAHQKGEILVPGTNSLAQRRRKIQMIFQDPFSSLDPRLTIRESLSEGMNSWNLHPNPEDRENCLNQLMDAVELPRESLRKYPHQFSGGQRQRIGIARALAVEPEVLICDECTSALDVSVQAQILTLLKEIQEKRHLAMLFITHDLGVVAALADRIAVMYLGEIVESGPAVKILHHPRHPYTKALLAAAPTLEKPLGQTSTQSLIQGEVPSPIHPPMGCRFHPRCPYATAECQQLSQKAKSRVIASSIDHLCSCLKF